MNAASPFTMNGSDGLKNDPDGSPIKDLSDKELVARIVKSGDMPAFGELYDRYSRSVLNRAWGMVGEKQLAEDLTQDIFLKLFANCSKYNNARSFGAWFSVLSYNVIIDELRKRKRIRIDPIHDKEHMISNTDDSEAIIQEKKLFDVRLDNLEHALKMLPTHERSMLLMKYQDGLSISDIATVFDLGESAVKMRLLRARQKVLELQEL